jgi:hypothetical protein
MWFGDGVISLTRFTSATQPKATFAKIIDNMLLIKQCHSIRTDLDLELKRIVSSESYIEIA